MSKQVLKYLYIVLLVGMPVVTCIGMIADVWNLHMHPGTLMDVGREAPILTFNLSGGLSVYVPKNLLSGALFLQVFPLFFAILFLASGEYSSPLRKVWDRFSKLSQVCVSVGILGSLFLLLARGWGAALLYVFGYVFLPLVASLLLIGLVALVCLIVYFIFGFFLEGLRSAKAQG